MKKIFVNLKDWFNEKENIDYSKEIKDLDIVLFPALPYLYIYKDVCKNLGVQDISYFSNGAHTGSVSIDHLKDFNIKWAILNHKELKITDLDVLYNKINNCIVNGIEIVLCINEVNAQELANIYELFNKTNGYEKIFIAYEPLTVLSEEEILNDINQIKDFCQNNFEKVNPIIYGGISENNIEKFSRNIDVSGFLISRHALDINELKTMINLVK